MNTICVTCLLDPTSHSFSRLYESGGIIYLYTCPAKATRYDDRVGILNHYSNLLASLNGQYWSWIFDCSGFEMKHCLQIQLAKDIAKLISQQYGSTLKKIHIINPTWHIQIVLNIVWPFLTQQTRSSIVYFKP